MGSLQVLQFQIGCEIERRRKMRRDPLQRGAIEWKIDLTFQEDCSQKLETFLEGGQAGLLVVQLEVKLREEIVGQLQRLGGSFGRLAAHEEVVRVAHQGLVEKDEALVELVQEEIGQHGG